MTACMASTMAPMPIACAGAERAVAGPDAGASVKHATISAANARALSSTVNSTTTPMPTASLEFANGGKSAPEYSPMRIDAALNVATVDTQSLHPIMSPAYEPNARWANTYCPPDLGTITPSSARDITPSSAYAPPATHASRNMARLGSSPATELGVRRIPDPIVLPTMIAIPNATPST